MLPGANHSRLIAKSGFDWVCVDCEHGNIAGWHHFSLIQEFGKRLIYIGPDTEMHASVAAIADCNVSPVVRIPANEGWMVKSMISQIQALLSV